MPKKPPFEYFVGQPPTALTPQSPQWSAPLPMHRQATGSEGPTDSSPDAITYGTYFAAARDFLRQNGLAVPVRAAASLLGRRVEPREIGKINIHLVKHGAFYHPALVKVVAGKEEIPLVLNVAVSAAGRAALAKEFGYLEQLNSSFTDRYVPQVFGCGRGAVEDQDGLPIFAAQWLSGYSEFHLTRAGEDSDLQQWQVWDDPEPWYLSPEQVADLYRQATAILTSHFNPLTFEAIVDWHHGAGDFVVKKEKTHIDVRLITVRRYVPLIQLEPHETIDPQLLLDTLMVLFISTSIRMRLDRLDGVGKLVWAPDHIMPFVWQGFDQGLRHMAVLHDFPDQFAQGVQEYMTTYTIDDILDIGKSVIQRFPPSSEESALATRHLSDHITILSGLMTGRA